MSSLPSSRLRIAAINFLNPAPLMWDFEHPPLDGQLAQRYRIDNMLPSECADRLAAGTAEIGLVPIAALATNPRLRILPGCVIASKEQVRSLLLVRRAAQPLASLRTVAADTASRTTVAHTRILFHQWGNHSVRFLPQVADLETMLRTADAAILIGDPALIALEERAQRLARTGEELVYHDIAQEWHKLTGLPFVSAVWGMAGSATARGSLPVESIAEDFINSRIHGMQHIDELASEWSTRIALSQDAIRSYLTSNIHYILDDQCLEAMKLFFRMAAATGVLPEYSVSVASQQVS